MKVTKIGKKRVSIDPCDLSKDKLFTAIELKLKNGVCYVDNRIEKVVHVFPFILVNFIQQRGSVLFEILCIIELYIFFIGEMIEYYHTETLRNGIGALCNININHVKMLITCSSSPQCPDMNQFAKITNIKDVGSILLLSEPDDAT